jgi:hypothetical protein
MLLLDTSDLPAEDRVEAFRAAFDHASVPCRIEHLGPDGTVRARMHLWAFGRATLFTSDSSGFRLVRTPRHVHRESPQAVALAVQSRGVGQFSQLGADHLVHSGEQDVAEEIHKLGGADAVILTAASPKPIAQAYASLAPGGTLVFVGLPHENEAPIPIFETVLNGITLRGSIVGTHQDLTEVFQLHRLGRTRVLQERRPLDRVNEHSPRSGRAAGSTGFPRTGWPRTTRL